MHFAKHCLLLVSFCGFFNTATANDSILWQDQNDIAARNTKNIEILNKGVRNARALTLDTESMKALLIPNSHHEDIQQRAAGLLSVEVPLPDGSNVALTLENTSVLPIALAARFSNIRTYKVATPSKHIVSGRVDFTERGFHAMLQTFDGQTIFIDPANQHTSNTYLSYRKAEQNNHDPFQCSSPGHTHAASPLQNRVAARTRSNEGLVAYRIAIAATAEYSQLQGGTIGSTLSAIATTLNRVNHVFEQSFGVQLTLVENNDLLIYTDSTTDPYSNFKLESMLAENQRNLDKVIGSEQYDIGHVFGTSGGGMAYIGSVCTSRNKARGASGIQHPNNDSFDIDYVAHEIGHQFGATHTFNSSQGICTSGARTARTAFEPGSGSSIMSYAGGCGNDNVQSFADAMFHSGNIEQVNSNLLSGSASACGVVHQTNNTAPMAVAGNNYTIPAHTPFALTAEAADADSDTLRYSWEQIDAGSSSTLKQDTGNNALFRVLPANNSATRTFPAMSTMLGTGFINGETLPSTTRQMNFQVAVYDGHHVPSLDRVNIQVINNGVGFRLHKPDSHYTPNTTIAVTWDTAGTQAAPISCPSVDLTLSTDGGKNFNTHLANNIPNTGNAAIFLPASVSLTQSGRFKLSCSNNIFFSISSYSFAIGQNIETATTETRGGNSAVLSGASNASGGGSMGISLILLLFIANRLRKQLVH
ncbi:MAG: reprolysin-like metallopeptidase [Leucothrix sp.]